MALMPPLRSSELRSLPSIDRLLRHPSAAAMLECYPRPLVVGALRAVLARVREAVEHPPTVPLVNGDSMRSGAIPDTEALLCEALDHLRGTETPMLRPVVNATGVILHTNLGRAVLAEEAVRAIVRRRADPLTWSLICRRAAEVIVMRTSKRTCRRLPVPRRQL